MSPDALSTAAGATPAEQPNPRRRRLGLRSAFTLAFAGGALVLSAVIAVGTFVVVRDYLVVQRERVAAGRGFADASYVRAGLLTESRQVSDVLAGIAPPSDAAAFLELHGEWYSTSISLQPDIIPVGLQEAVDTGGAGVAWTTVEGQPAVVVGTAMPGVDAEFFEITLATELDGTLETLGVVLFGFAVVTTLGGAVLARWASRRVLAPLQAVGGTTGRIAAGDLANRLEPTDDPDLAPIVTSFNQMVDALQERIDRDTRFTADVSHELRSPLTTLTTSVSVLQRRRDELSPTSRDALDLAVAELERFRSVLEALLELGRIDAGASGHRAVPVDARTLVQEALAASGRPTTLLRAPSHDPGPLLVDVDKQRMSRALINLFDNADLHGGGLVAVEVDVVEADTVDPSAGAEGLGGVRITVDDDGPGVEPAERARIFDRFVRGGSRRSRPGAGLGLSLVAETVRAHGGMVECTSGPRRGARFTIDLPRAAAEPTEDRPVEAADMAEPVAASEPSGSLR